MFKALNTKTDKEVIILDREWMERLNHLRALDRKDKLVCPECKQPVRVRAGQVKRWHFAHKHLRDCPLSKESPEILQARALLYQWLVSKFESSHVTLEKKLDRDFLPRPIDCWVETRQNDFAYWLVEAQVKPQQRDAFADGFDDLGINVHYLFLTRMLNENKEEPGEIYLTTTERDFMQPSEYDQIGHNVAYSLPHRFSLHYLDPNEETVTTYRDLHLVHRPQVFEGLCKIHPLAEMLVLGTTGEFVHPDEHEQLQTWKKEKADFETRQMELEAERRRKQQEAEKQWQQLQRDLAEPQVERFEPPLSPRQPRRDDSRIDKLFIEAECEECGQVTSHWYAYDNKTKKCKCMDCYQRKSL